MSHSEPRTSRSFPEGEMPKIKELLKELNRIHNDLVKCENLEKNDTTKALHSSSQKSAINLLHYLELRTHDVRPMQQKLSYLGLSSLGRAEAHVMATVKAVLRTLYFLSGQELPQGFNAGTTVDFNESSELLESHTMSLMGPPPPSRSVRIMVTMPEEAATEPALVNDLLSAGMDCMRINCAHDDESAWTKMIEHLHEGERQVGRKCRVLMDIPGPKLRTGAITSPAIIKCKPRRDEFGRVAAPARVWIYPAESAEMSGPSGAQIQRPNADAHIPLPAAFVERLAAGDVVAFKDCRGAGRKLTIVGTAGECRWAESIHTFYLSPGVKFRWTQTNNVKDTAEAQVQAMAPSDPHISLKKGDTLLLTESQAPGRGAVCDSAGNVLQLATVPCTLPEVFADLKPGEQIWFDDGKIGGVILHVDSTQVRVEITRCPGPIARLRPDKGINLPDSKLNLSALTKADLEKLPFLASHADLIGMSFIERSDDVLDLQERLKNLGGKLPGIVLKIETRRAFEALPALLLAAMRNPCAGVMIARGDLAVECGFERLAEIQEEVLWICEAAHMPVIWATQVLESLAKSGQPSRAEVTDAAMGVRAECVMLNKGPHILHAVKSLADILQRMQGHQHKKQSLLRQLHSWEAK